MDKYCGGCGSGVADVVRSGVGAAVAICGERNSGVRSGSAARSCVANPLSAARNVAECHKQSAKRSCEAAELSAELEACSGMQCCNGGRWRRCGSGVVGCAHGGVGTSQKWRGGWRVLLAGLRSRGVAMRCIELQSLCCIRTCLAKLNECVRAQACCRHECLMKLNGIFRYPTGRPHECLYKLNKIICRDSARENDRSNLPVWICVSHFV